MIPSAKQAHSFCLTTSANGGRVVDSFHDSTKICVSPVKKRELDPSDSWSRTAAPVVLKQVLVCCTEPFWVASLTIRCGKLQLICCPLTSIQFTVDRSIAKRPLRHQPHTVTAYIPECKSFSIFFYPFSFSATHSPFACFAIKTKKKNKLEKNLSCLSDRFSTRLLNFP